jgi:uncharacterized protein YutE (UPF0331/DUF86 family)
MAAGNARPADRRRWRRDVVRRLEDFPRQYAALERAMQAFGDDFDLRAFKTAFHTTEDMDAYNRVQAVEHALGRVQNYVAELAQAGAKLAGLVSRDVHASAARRGFEALREAGVISGALCRRLVQAQGARARIEHGYVDTTARDVHQTAQLVHASAIEFIGAYRRWIEPHLADDDG